MTKKERYERFMAYFQEAMPEANTELHYKNPFQLLCAVMLSAQCTDKRVNMVTPALFEAYPTPQAMSVAHTEHVRIDSHPCFAPRYTQHNVCGFPSHARQSHQRIKIGWHFTIVLFCQQLCHLHQMLCFAVGVTHRLHIV